MTTLEELLQAVTIALKTLQVLKATKSDVISLEIHLNKSLVYRIHVPSDLPPPIFLRRWRNGFGTIT